MPLRLSVVIATTQPWPEVAPCLESLRVQMEAVDGEVLLGDGSAAGMPEGQAARHPRVRLLHRPGASVFELRAAAVAAARADVIAITEDHCVPAEDWCERILAAHAGRPEAVAIGGLVENGATATRIDWASFFLVNGGSLPPLPAGARRTIALQANVSYKRAALRTRGFGLGQMEWLLNRDLREHGGVLVNDERIRVTHVQSLGVAATCRIHFDDGRTIASFRMERMGAVEWLVRIAACTVMPPLLVARTLVAVLPKRCPWTIVGASVPWMLVLATCKAWGNLLGFLHGPGASPARIR